MVRRWLVTTAMEATWPVRDEPILFLGEWCCRFGRRGRWNSLNADVLPYHWDDRVKFENDFRDLRQVYERLLTQLAAQLNLIHGVARSVRFWRILIGPWLGFFVQILFDRWAMIEAAVQRGGLTGAHTLGGDAGHLIPNDLDEFIGFYGSDEWNELIYTKLLKEHTDVRCEEVPRSVSVPDGSLSSARPASITRLRRAGIDALSRIAWLAAREHDAVLVRTYLPLSDELRLHTLLRQFPQYSRAIPTPRSKIDSRMRRWNLEATDASPFERIARSFIPHQLPRAYLEGFSRLAEDARRAAWPAAPRLIFTSNALYSEELFKFWTASKVETGTPLVVGQHGGHYGIGRVNFSEEHEIAISDRYLSWGWTAPSAPTVEPVGQLKRRGPLGVNHAKKQELLMITCGMPRYSYWMYSVPVGPQYLRYLNDQTAFYLALRVDIREHVLVRLYGPDIGPNGWEQAARLQAALPGGRFDAGSGPIESLIRQSRLVVATYNATTFLETFAQDVPTVMFWNCEYWEIREAAQPYFEALRAVGVFHTSPESAALHIGAIWSDIDGWWHSPRVRDAVTSFCNEYSFLPENLLDRLALTLERAADFAQPAGSR